MTEVKPVLELYRMPDNSLAFKTEFNSALPRIALASLPKAGTYLFGQILEELGFVNIEMHFGENNIDDYRNLSVEQKQQNPANLRFNMPFDIAARFVHPGQYMLGHMPCTPDTQKALASYKRIFVYRNLRDALISDMRFLEKTGRPAPGKDIWEKLEPVPKTVEYLKTRGKWLTDVVHKRMLPWIQDPAALKISFEHLTDDNNPVIQENTIKSMARFCQVPCDNPAALLEKVFNTKTKTKSDKRSDFHEYWSDEAEEIFRAIQGDQINKILGYKD